MLERSYKRILSEYEWLPAAILLVLGCALRLVELGSLPYGLNQDEASSGYEALALLAGGVDRCGSSWPVLFISWGSGQNVLMSYLAMPFVALLGLTETAVRLPNALSGCATLLGFWLLARRARGRSFGLFALFMLCINPWHIMMSRWALESNLLPFFLVWGLYFCSAAKERPWMLPGAAVSFGLMLYAYGTAFFFLPFFLVAAVLWLRKQLKWQSFCLSLALFAALALPIALCQLRNMLELDAVTFLGITLPRLTQGRQVATSVLGGGGLSAAMDNFRNFLHILWYQSDGLSYNAMPLRQGGLFYFFGLPAAILGLLSHFLRHHEGAGERPVLLALVAALICAALIHCNVNRINMVWMPLIYFSALGIYDVLCKLKNWAVIPLGGLLLCFVIFWNSYTDSFKEPGNVNYFPGLGAAIQYADAMNEDCVYITDYVNAPYIFALFYTETEPTLFRESVVYRDENAAFRSVDRFAGYVFAREEKENADVLILHRSEIDGREVLASFGSYAVCIQE